MEQTKFVGVDCHKNTIACYVNGKFKEFKTDFKGFKKALEWAGKDCHWALEGAYSTNFYNRCKKLHPTS